MEKPLRVLMVEDSEDDALLMIRALKKGGYKLVYERVEDAEAMRKALREKTWDVILCDYRLPHFNGLAAIALLKDTGIDLPLIIVSGAIGEETAADCMRYGAHDYIMKNNLTRLVPAIERELKESIVRREFKLVSDSWVESEERFRRISSMTSDIAYSCSTKEDGRFSIDWMTGATERISGYSIEEIKAQSCWRFLVIEEDIALFKENVTDLAPGSHGACELRIRHKNGGIVWLASHAECVMGTEMPERFQLYGALVDITDRKRAEESLRESEERYRTIIESMEDGYHEVDIKGNFTFFNESMRKILGYEREELLGMNNRQYADEKNTRKVYQTYNRVYRTGEPVKNFEWQIIRKDGDRRNIEVSISLIRDGEAHPTGFRGIVRDTTDHKRAEEDLRQAEERYRSIFENAQEGIYRSTPGGRIILANPAMAKIYGYASPEELMNGITDVARQIYVNPEERAEMLLIVEERGLIVKREIKVYRKDGIIIWISLTIDAVRDEKGQTIFYEGMVEDITNRKENVERMRKALGATVQAIAVTVETRDPYTAGHQRRVADLARSIATEMNLPADQIDGIRMAAIIHDLGKISVPAEILSKPTRLTALEFSLIKTHAQSGYDILKDIDFTFPVARMILEHHERMDGSGYPQGLIAEEALLESRILAVADVVESMASHRPYRPTLGIDAAMKEIEKNKGTLYDTDAVDACLRLFREKGYQLE